MPPLLIGAGLASVAGSVANGIGGAMAADDKTRAYEELQQRLEGVRDPQFSKENYTPDQLQLTQYGPQQEYVGQQIADSPESRAMMMQALQRMAGNADQSIGSQNELDRYQAMSQASRQNAGAQGAIASAMARRGQMTPGMELMMRQQAAQGAYGDARGDSMRAAANAALQRLSANNAMFGAAGQLRGQDIGLNSANTDIINKFNVMNTGQRNAINNANVDLVNRGSIYNNTNNNGAKMYNLDRGDKNAMNLYGAHYQKAGGVGQAGIGAAQSRGEGYQAIGGAINSGLSSLANLAGGAAAGGMMGGGAPGGVTPLPQGPAGYAQPGYGGMLPYKPF